ncbi:MAG: tRNA pseudouridine(55) synthase TruB, partial [Gammaproteobacteria bacterium CG_4_9_14_3_um_filter_38_9]
MCVNGIFLLDKPSGVSSNLALQKVKRLLQIKKAGHAGTLDPLATGMLPIAFNEATKFLSYLLDADKTYSVTMQLGVRTTTSDSEGEVIAKRNVPDFSISQMNAVFDLFRGETQQIPSMFSALKYKGVPLYEYARKGITVDRASRAIRIDDITILSMENHNVHFTVRCSKGTYIRTLVDDVGEQLGCGAHVTRLRRLSVSVFSEMQMMSLEKLGLLLSDAHFSLDAVLLPMDTVLSHFPTIGFSEIASMHLKQGKTVAHTDATDLGLVRLLDQQKQFFGMGEVIS